MEKTYRLGYVPGVFDLFHVGHLNLLKRSKERCEYLIAGVLTDELVEHFKGKTPMIPFEERIEIVKAIKYVDEVIPVTFENTDKMDAWNLLHFDCHFSGNDHGPDWEEELAQLKVVGANMEFLPYTKGVSSTGLVSQLHGEAKNGKLFLFGAGAYGRRYLRLFRNSPKRGQWQLAGFIDNSPEKRHSIIDGVTVYGLDEVPLIAQDEDYTIVITTKYPEKMEEQLREAGIEKFMRYDEFPGWKV